MLDVIYYTLYAFSIIGIFTVSALVYLRRKEAEYRYFAIFAALLNIWLIVQFVAQLFSGFEFADATVLLRASVAVSPFFIVYFFLFATSYVGKKLNKPVHFMLPIIAAILSVATDLVVRTASASVKGIVLQDGPLYYPIFGFVIMYALASAIVIIKEGRSKKNLTYSRKQANIILIVGVLQAILIVSVAAIFFADDPFGQVLIPFALFLMVVIFSYAIVRHRLFDIRLVVVRALAYSLSLTTVVAAYLLLAVGLARIFPALHSDFVHQAFYLVVAVFLALTYAPLKTFFDKITRKIFYQDAYESQKVIDAFSGVLVSTVDIKQLSQHATHILQEAIKSQYVIIILPPDSANGKGRFIVRGGKGSYKEDGLYEILSEYPEKLIVQDEIYSERKKLSEKMQSVNCAVAARLETHDSFIGYILFGIKNNGKAYTHQDIELIRITTDELALGIQNALSVQEVKDINDTLKDRIEEATKELRATNAQLQRLDEAKDEFISMASHQLRTPLTSVKGYISMVLEGDAGKIAPSQRHLLSEAFASSERMVHLINDFLNVSRLQTGKFMLEQRPVDLAKVVKQEVESLQTTVKMHDLKLKFKAPSYFPILNIDEGKIRQVIMNFIDNAIYYSRENSTITVNLAIEDGAAVLEVQDTGIGVPKEEQAHLFGKFFRATNARKQRPDGTGVGLFLAKKVILAHGGTILFHSVEGEGSTFGFRLPVKKLERAAVSHGTDKLHK